MARPLQVVLVGLGPIGQAIGRLLVETPGVRIVGATDPSTEHAGKDLGPVLGLSRRLRVRVAPEPERFFRKARADVAILATSSSLKIVRGQVAALVQRQINVLTTCEELSFPRPELASVFRDLDRLAQRKKVSILSIGVNPGYAMDALPIMLTAPSSRVNRIAVTRVVDAGSRRLPLQRKVGAGLNLNQFRRAMTEGTVRHAGLVESVYMIASALGWTLERVEESLEPAIAPRDLETEYLRIPAGSAAGIRQAARGFRDGEPAVSLDLQMYVGAENPRDHVLVDGIPRIDMTIAPGLPGDVATAGIVVNAIPKVVAARPGLLSTKDLPLLHYLNPLELKGLPRRKR